MAPRIWTKPLRELTEETTLGFEVIRFAEEMLLGAPSHPGLPASPRERLEPLLRLPVPGRDARLGDPEAKEDLGEEQEATPVRQPVPEVDVLRIVELTPVAADRLVVGLPKHHGRVKR